MMKHNFVEFGNFSYTTFRIVCQAETFIEFPDFKESYLHGQFGLALRRHHCRALDGTDCHRCPLADECAYARLFSVPGHIFSDIERGNSDLPQPVLLDFFPGQELKRFPGEQFSLRLVFFGSSIKYFPVVFSALSAVGKKMSNGGRFFIREVTCLRQGFEEIIPLSSITASTTIAPDIFTPKTLLQKDYSGIRIEFISPVRIFSDGHLMAQPSFTALVRGILRRYSWISELYCDGSPPLAFTDISSSAKDVVAERVQTSVIANQRYSSRQRRGIKLYGVTGFIDFSPQSIPFFPLLQLGSLIALGKSTSFGFGRIAIKPIKR